MKRAAILLVLLVGTIYAQAQVLKPRPDAFPPVSDTLEPKALLMASSLEEMTAAWDRYPTYELYLEMMQRYADLKSEYGVNIVDITQSVMRDYFAMIMLADIDALTIPFGDFVDEMKALGDSKGLVIQTMHEDIFDSMHKI